MNARFFCGVNGKSLACYNHGNSEVAWMEHPGKTISIGFSLGGDVQEDLN
jgi:hypothetical protein